jgi:hypothetical protein
MRQNSASGKVPESDDDGTTSAADPREIYVRVRSNEEAYKDADVLRFLYHDAGMSLRQISDLFQITRQTVSNWMDKNGIDTREPLQGFRQRQISEMKIPEGQDMSIKTLQNFLVSDSKS